MQGWCKGRSYISQAPAFVPLHSWLRSWIAVGSRENSRLPVSDRTEYTRGSLSPFLIPAAIYSRRGPLSYTILHHLPSTPLSSFPKPPLPFPFPFPCLTLHALLLYRPLFHRWTLNWMAVAIFACRRYCVQRVTVPNLAAFNRFWKSFILGFWLSKYYDTMFRLKENLCINETFERSYMIQMIVSWCVTWFIFDILSVERYRFRNEAMQIASSAIPRRNDKEQYLWRWLRPQRTKDCSPCLKFKF